MTKTKSIKPAPVQKYLQIEQVKDGVVILRDGRLRMILELTPVNFDLKSEKEKEAAIYQYQSFLNSLKFPIQIVIQSRRIDLSGYINKVEKATGAEVNELLRNQSEDYLNFIRVLSEEINIMDKSFYIIVGHTAKGAVEKETIIDKILKRKSSAVTQFSQEEFQEYKSVLLERVRTVSGRLNALGITSKELGTREIIELLYNTYNPEEAVTQHLTKPEEMTSAVVKQAKEVATQASTIASKAAESLEIETAQTVSEKNPASNEIELAAPKSLKRSGLSEILSRAGIRPKPDRSEEEIIRQGIASVLDIIAPAGFNIAPTYIQLGNFYVRTLFVYTYPRYLQANWLSPIINYDATIDISMIIHPIETNFLMGQLRRKTTQLQASEMVEREKGLVRNPELETAISDIEELRDTLQKGETRLFQFSLYFTLYATSLEELNKLSKQFEAILGGSLIYTKQALLQMETGFNATLPLMDDRLDIVRNLDTSSLSTTFPFTSAELSHHDGVLYGINLHNSSLVLFDRFRMENANQVVFAKSGAGKSYAVKLEAIRSLMMDSEIVVIDPENEYKNLAEAVGGTYVNMSLSSPQKVNPFDLPAFREETDESGEQILRTTVTSVHGLIGMMTGGLSPEEDSLLDKALYETYALRDITIDVATHSNQSPLMSDLVTVLQNMSGTDSLINRLSKYTEGSFANLFNSPTNIDLTNKMTVFSIRDMEDELRPIAMYLVLNYIWTRVKSELKKRLLIIDEGWWMMRYEDSAKFLNAMVKRARKYYLGVTVISQDVEDFLSSNYGRSVVNNSATQLLLGQSTSAIDKVAEIFKLTDGEKFFLTEAEVGQGLFFAGTNRAAIQIVSSYSEDQIITTDPKQLLEIYGLKK